MLEGLIRIDTRNPGGDERGLSLQLARLLVPFRPDRLDVVPVLGGHSYVLASFGLPKTLVNAHIDTVPTAAGWTRPPHEPYERDGRIFGLGAADTKGAIAAALTALELARPRDLGLLFSGDEEHGGSCMRAFLASDAAQWVKRALVCEPTGLRVGTRHRGLMTFRAEAQGEGGHSSLADALDKPVVTLCRVAVALDDWSRLKLLAGPPGFKGMCVNVAELRGGVAFNVVPPMAELIWSLRPPPGANIEEVKTELAQLMPPNVLWRATLENPPFETKDVAGFQRLLGSRVDSPIDLGFWTEAALLSAAGIDAVVWGPGDVASAHAANESVAIAELDEARMMLGDLYRGSV